jgi:3-mercaptopyruvate sulfurtransferase SseA
VRISTVAIASGLLWHLVAPDGFFLNRSAVASVVANFHSTSLPRVTTDELRTLLRDGDSVVIDARRPQDFRGGHIEGAINVPVGASLGERQRAMAGVAASARIVLYCQSEACQWASELANVLSASGYRNLSLYPGGWREWSQSLPQDNGGKRRLSP